MSRNQNPAEMLLAEDIGFGGLALGMERIEILIETFLGGLARVYSAANCGTLLCIAPLREAEKEEAIPARAGDLAGDGAQGTITAGFIFKSFSEHFDDDLPVAETAGKQSTGPGTCNPSAVSCDQCAGNRNLREPRIPSALEHEDRDRRRSRRLVGAPVRSDLLRHWPADERRFFEIKTAGWRISILPRTAPGIFIEGGDLRTC